MSASIAVHGVRKCYGAIAAVDGFSYRFRSGRITTILGPSGSGKSTTLGIIAGLIPPDQGQVHCNGVDITSTAADARDFGLVFQNYALFPHMSVAENVEFGLRVRGVGRQERRQRARDFLERVQIRHLADRRVQQVSGGEQQRVALARALAFEPKVLLMDEPLSALDAKLRETLRAELHRLLRQLELTTIYVTHDQGEAMSLGDDMIIINQGRIEQAGPPFQLYRRPANAFVADFLGSTNLCDARCVQDNGARRLELPFATVSVSPEVPLGPCLVIIRPEDLELTSEGKEDFIALHDSSLFLGNHLRLSLSVGTARLTMDVPNDFTAELGPRLPVQIKTSKLCVLPKEASHGT